jgi:hypothetical protein
LPQERLESVSASLLQQGPNLQLFVDPSGSTMG